MKAYRHERLIFNESVKSDTNCDLWLESATLSLSYVLCFHAFLATGCLWLHDSTVMLYDSTKSLLRNILRTLETPGNTAWDDQVESSKACLYEMHQMSHGLQKAYKTDKAGTQSQDTLRVLRAMPHVRSMAIAIRLRDQAKAIEASKAALAEM